MSLVGSEGASASGVAVTDGIVVYEIVIRTNDRAIVDAALPGRRIDLGNTETMLLCEVPDQWALFRVLDRIFDVGLELLTVRRIAERPVEI